MSNNDPNLVGKWVRKELPSGLAGNGIGSKEKGVVVTEDIKKLKESGSLNNNFL